MRQTVYLAVVAVAGLLGGCSKAPPKVPPTPAEAKAPATAVVAEVPLKTILAAAISCVTDCKTVYKPNVNELIPSDITLPRKFAELLADANFRAKYEAAVNGLPTELQEPLTNRPGTTPTGSLSLVVSKGGGQAYLYGLVRFDPPGQVRSYADIAVDPLTKDVAILMRPTPNLDQYYLTGPDQLQALLLLDAAATDVRLAKQELKRVENPEAPTDWQADPFVLPLEPARAAEVSERLKYLNTKYEGGRLTNVDSPDALVKAKLLQQQATWYVADLNFANCISSMSPAQRIATIKDSGVQVRTKDRTDASGRLVEVEVSYDEGNHERYYRYFKLKEDCVASLVRSEPIPDRYR